MSFSFISWKFTGACLCFSGQIILGPMHHASSMKHSTSISPNNQSHYAKLFSKQTHSVKVFDVALIMSIKLSMSNLGGRYKGEWMKRIRLKRFSTQKKRAAEVAALLGRKFYFYHNQFRILSQKDIIFLS